MHKKEKAKLWKDHFDKLPNAEDLKRLIKTGIKEISKVEVEEVIIEDVEKTIKNLQNNK
jgi:hypothetical protein